MPQLIAMVIVVVGAMIYMFQTFGGTGDKIEGIAQKTSIITEINNIKNGLKLAARSEQIVITSAVPAGGGAAVVSASNLKGLGTLKYFAEQINDQLEKNVATADGADNYVKENAYNAISFGGNTTTIGGMFVSLVADRENLIPGIFVSFNFKDSTLKDSSGFFEAQIANDLKDIAYIDRKAKAATAAAGVRTSATDTSTIAARTPGDSAGGTEADGKFIIYFKDFGSNEIVLKQ